MHKSDFHKIFTAITDRTKTLSSHIFLFFHKEKKHVLQVMLGKRVEKKWSVTGEEFRTKEMWGNVWKWYKVI